MQQVFKAFFDTIQVFTNHCVHLFFEEGVFSDGGNKLWGFDVLRVVFASLLARLKNFVESVQKVFSNDNNHFLLEHFLGVFFQGWQAFEQLIFCPSDFFLGFPLDFQIHFCVLSSFWFCGCVEIKNWSWWVFHFVFNFLFRDESFKLCFETLAAW